MKRQLIIWSIIFTLLVSVFAYKLHRSTVIAGELSIIMQHTGMSASNAYEYYKSMHE